MTDTSCTSFVKQPRESYNLEPDRSADESARSMRASASTTHPLITLNHGIPLISFPPPYVPPARSCILLGRAKCYLDVASLGMIAHNSESPVFGTSCLMGHLVIAIPSSLGASTIEDTRGYPSREVEFLHFRRRHHIIGHAMNTVVRAAQRYRRFGNCLELRRSARALRHAARNQKQRLGALVAMRSEHTSRFADALLRRPCRSRQLQVFSSTTSYALCSLSARS